MEPRVIHAETRHKPSRAIREKRTMNRTRPTARAKVELDVVEAGEGFAMVLLSQNRARSSCA